MSQFEASESRIPVRKRDSLEHIIGKLFGSRQMIPTSLDDGRFMTFDPRSGVVTNRISLFRANLESNIQSNIINLSFPMLGKNGTQFSMKASSESELNSWTGLINQHILYANERNKANLKAIEDEEVAFATARCRTFTLDSNDGTGGITPSSQSNSKRKSISGKTLILDDHILLSSPSRDSNEGDGQPRSREGWVVKQSETSTSHLKLRYFTVQHGYLRYFTATKPSTLSPRSLAAETAAAGGAGAGAGVEGPGAEGSCAEGSAVEESGAEGSATPDDAATISTNAACPGPADTTTSGATSSKTAAVDATSSKTAAVNTTSPKTAAVDYHHHNNSAGEKITMETISKGLLNIQGYEVTITPGPDSVKITLAPGYKSTQCKRKLELYCDDHADALLWQRALQQNAEMVM